MFLLDKVASENDTIQEVLEKADSLIQTEQPESAKKFYFGRQNTRYPRAR